MFFWSWLKKMTTNTAPEKETPVDELKASDPEWVRKAWAEMGTAEISGDKDNPRIVYYHSFTSLRASDDETPWCSAFMNFLFAPKGTRDAMARSWLKWGEPTSRKRGAIVVFASPSRGPSAGHVALVLGEADENHLYVLGGNQNNMVCVARYPKSLVLGYRWPN